MRNADGQGWRREQPTDNERHAAGPRGPLRADSSERADTYMRQEARSPGSVSELGSGSWPTARHAAWLRHRARHGWRQLGFRRQFVAILVGAAVASAVGTVVLAALWMPPVRPEVGLLLLIGLALTTLCLYAGYRLSGPVSHRAFTALTGGLDQIAASAVQLEAHAADQRTRSRQQALLARQLSEEVRALGEAAERLEQGVTLLRDTAGQLWAEMSYPVAAVDTPLSSRSARQAAITAGQIGATIEQTTALCYRLRARTNLVIAEADLLGAQGREMQHEAGVLREGVCRVEEALSGPVPTPTFGATDRVDAVLRPTRGMVRGIVGTVVGAMVRWGAPYQPRSGADEASTERGTRLAPASGVAARNALHTNTVNPLNPRVTPARGASLSRASSGRHPAAGAHAHPASSTTRGRAPSRPRPIDTAPYPASGADGTRFAAPDQSPRPPRSTSHPDDDWLNGLGDHR